MFRDTKGSSKLKYRQFNFHDFSIFLKLHKMSKDKGKIAILFTNYSFPQKKLVRFQTIFSFDTTWPPTPSDRMVNTPNGRRQNHGQTQSG